MTLKHIVYACLLLGAASLAQAEDAVVAVADRKMTPIQRDMRIVEPLPDFTSFTSAEEKKQAFFHWLRPVVEAENARIMQLRRRLLSLQGKLLSAEEKSWLRDLFYRYRVPLSQWGSAITVLLRRVDMVPVELALAQAAKESGWGTSRFAIEGNNLFGQWCFRQGCGIVPARRADAAKHEVAVFATPAAAIRAYIHNLNSGHAYTEFRTIRVGLHRMGKPLSANVLVVGLLNYSGQGQAYVDEIRAIVRGNDDLMQTARESVSP